MSRLKDRLLNYHIQVKKFADDDQMILANDVLSMIEQLQDDLKRVLLRHWILRGVTC